MVITRCSHCRDMKHKCVLVCTRATHVEAIALDDEPTPITLLTGSDAVEFRESVINEVVSWSYAPNKDTIKQRLVFEYNGGSLGIMGMAFCATRATTLLIPPGPLMYDLPAETFSSFEPRGLLCGAV